MPFPRDVLSLSLALSLSLEGGESGRERESSSAEWNVFSRTFRSCSSAVLARNTPAFFSTGRIAVQPYAVPEHRITCRLASVNSAVRRAGDTPPAPATSSSPPMLAVIVQITTKINESLSCFFFAFF
jgi:hypothetical protein